MHQINLANQPFVSPATFTVLPFVSRIGAAPDKDAFHRFVPAIIKTLKFLRFLPREVDEAGVREQLETVWHESESLVARQRDLNSADMEERRRLVLLGALVLNDREPVASVTGPLLAVSAGELAEKILLNKEAVVRDKLAALHWTGCLPDQRDRLYAAGLKALEEYEDRTARHWDQPLLLPC